MQSAHLPWATFVVFATLLTTSAVRADFDPRSTSWDGLSRFAAIAAEEAAAFDAPEEIDLRSLSSGDALFLVAPGAPLPLDDLVRFVRRGGRLVVADDFGVGAELLARFGIGLGPVDPAGAAHVRSNRDLLVALPSLRHPLNADVQAIVTNRPMALSHPRLSPIFTVGASPLVLTGVVGDGRVVALGDPSVLLNQMMELAPNRRFARNLVDFVAGGDTPRRMVLATSRTRFAGGFDADAPGSTRERLESFFGQLSETRIPSAALRVLATCLALVSMILLASIRPRRLEPAQPWLEAGDAVRSTTRLVLDEVRDAVALALRRRLGAATESPRDVSRALRTLVATTRRENAALASADSHEAVREVAEVAHRLDREIERRRSQTKKTP